MNKTTDTPHLRHVRGKGNRHSFLRNLVRTVPHLERTAIAVLLVIVAIVLFWLIRKGKDNHVEISQDEKINLTPTQVRSLEDIGEWEFLSIADEELVDTVSRGFFGDNELVRIYYGTLRLGVNMHEVAPDWITMDGDTVSVLLPPIKLLNNDFIDEARTKSFYEHGDWSHADRQAMYDKACHAMLSRCLTPSNIHSAEQNASRQVTAILRAMGFPFVRVRFQKR